MGVIITPITVIAPVMNHYPVIMPILLRHDYRTAASDTDDYYPHYCYHPHDYCYYAHYCHHPMINYYPVAIPILLPHDYRTAASDTGGGGGRIFAHLISLSRPQFLFRTRSLSHTISLTRAPTDDTGGGGGI